MAKRFTDSGKWEDNFFYQLSPNYKLLWIYFLDKCDHAGIVEFNLPLAGIFVGLELNESEVLEIFKGKIVKFKEGKIFIPNFIKFQYGTLNTASKPHQSVINKLKSYNLLDYLENNYQNDNNSSEIKEYKENSKGLAKGIDALKDKAKEKEYILSSITTDGNQQEPSLDEVLEFGKQSGFDVLECKNFYNHYQSVDWYTAGHNPQKIIRWKPKLQQWMNKTDQFRGPTPNVEGKEQNKPYEYQIIRE